MGEGEIGWDEVQGRDVLISWDVLGNMRSPGMVVVEACVLILSILDPLFLGDFFSTG